MHEWSLPDAPYLLLPLVTLPLPFAGSVAFNILLHDIVVVTIVVMTTVAIMDIPEET